MRPWLMIGAAARRRLFQWRLPAGRRHAAGAIDEHATAHSRLRSTVLRAERAVGASPEQAAAHDVHGHDRPGVSRADHHAVGVGEVGALEAADRICRQPYIRLAEPLVPNQCRIRMVRLATQRFAVKVDFAIRHRVLENPIWVEASQADDPVPFVEDIEFSIQRQRWPEKETALKNLPRIGDFVLVLVFERRVADLFAQRPNQATSVDIYSLEQVVILEPLNASHVTIGPWINGHEAAELIVHVLRWRRKGRFIYEVNRLAVVRQ